MKYLDRFARITLMLMFAAVIAAGCGGDDNPTGSNGDGDGNGTPTAPEEWIGRWAGTNQFLPCSSPLVGGDDLDTFSVCEDDRFEDTVPEDFDFDCDITWTSSKLEFTCTGTFSFGGCTATATNSGTATRSGDQVTVSQRSETSFEGNCGGQKNFCEQLNGTYTRISNTPDPSECFSGDGDGGGGDGGGDPSNELNVDISGDGPNLSVNAPASALRIEGTYNLTASFVDGDNIYGFLMNVPVIDSVPTTLCIDVEQLSGCVVAGYSEFSDGNSGTLETATGTMTITQADASRFTATFEFSGNLVGSNPGTRTFSNGSIDVAVIEAGLAAHSHFPWVTRR